MSGSTDDPRGPWPRSTSRPQARSGGRAHPRRHARDTRRRRRSSRRWRVELLREKSRRRLENLVSTFGLGQSPLQLGNAGVLDRVLLRHDLARGAGALIVLADPRAQALRIDAQLSGHPGDLTTPPALGSLQVTHHPHDPLLQLHRILVRRRHRLHPYPNPTNHLHQTRGATGLSGAGPSLMARNPGRAARVMGSSPQVRHG